MSTYIIGDIQGCFDSLQTLLEKIAFNPNTDRLGFAGDLVNRGPKSLETLRFIRKLENPIVALGNHDLHLLSLYFHPNNQKQSHTLSSILSAHDCDDLISWLLKQSLMHYSKEHDFLLVHAGIPPQWTIHQAITLECEVRQALQSNPADFFKHMYGNKPNIWHDKLIGWDRLRYIINALTRMRFCDANGVLDLENTTAVSNKVTFQPWFQWRKSINTQIIFGHWAALAGQSNRPNFIALDTGCVWGKKLTAIRIEDRTMHSVPSQESD